MTKQGTAKFPQHGTVTWITENNNGTAYYKTTEGEEEYTTDGGKLTIPLKDGRQYIVPFTEPEIRNDVLYQTEGDRKIVLQRGKPGAKAEPLYDDAYKTVAKGNFTKEVYNEAFDNYCRQANLTKPDRNARNAFKAAIKRRRDGLATQ